MALLIEWRFEQGDLGSGHGRRLAEAEGLPEQPADCGVCRTIASALLLRFCTRVPNCADVVPLHDTPRTARAGVTAEPRLEQSAERGRGAAGGALPPQLLHCGCGLVRAAGQWDGCSRPGGSRRAGRPGWLDISVGFRIGLRRATSPSLYHMLSTEVISPFLRCGWLSSTSPTPCRSRNRTSPGPHPRTASGLGC